MEPLAVTIRGNADIRCIEGGSKHHKLLLYADDILVLLNDPSYSTPRLMDTIKLYSNVSEVKINWTKSEAMPLSGTSSGDKMTKLGFKWVPKGMKYLGIKICKEVEEMPNLNFDPILQNMKINLDKQNRVDIVGKSECN